jgi:hypothetical protein
MSKDERKLKEVRDQLDKRLIALEAGVNVLKARQRPQKQPLIIIVKGKGKKKEGLE